MHRPSIGPLIAFVLHSVWRVRWLVMLVALVIAVLAFAARADQAGQSQDTDPVTGLRIAEEALPRSTEAHGRIGEAPESSASMRANGCCGETAWSSRFGAEAPVAWLPDVLATRHQPGLVRSGGRAPRIWRRVPNSPSPRG